MNMTRFPFSLMAILSFAAALHAADEPTRDWLLARAYKFPSEYTNQESGYFSIVAGQNGRLYIGAAKYGVNAYLIEFAPNAEKSTMVVDVMKTINSNATGFAAQA